MGYRTCISGKWHLGSRSRWGPLQFGFQSSYGSLAGGVGPFNHRYKRGPYTHTWHRNDRLIQDTGHVTDLITDEAIRCLDDRSDSPLFLYVPYTAVHTPFHEPQQYLERNRHIEVGRRQYAASVSHLDDSIGKIRAALGRAGIADNTLTLFFSDNGGARSHDNHKYPGRYPARQRCEDNRPLRGWKKELYEGGIRVPAFVHWPEQLQSRRVAAPLHVVDWLPTLAKLVGMAPPVDPMWDGRDVWPLLTGQAATFERTLYWRGTGGNQVAVRRGAWKLIVRRETAEAQATRHELFDLKRDPYERNDLSASHPDRVQELLGILAEEQSRDDVAVPVPAALPAEGASPHR